ncbi:MAG: nuclear transport factor 2 family protein [Acidimicrobiales bacterium]|jgi:ketosteroid isomerase-like protein
MTTPDAKGTNSMGAATPEFAITTDAATTSEFLEAVTEGDVDRALTLCRPEIFYSVPGRGTIGGDHIGASAVRAALCAPPRTGARTLRLLTHTVIGEESPVVSHLEVLAELDGEPVRYRMMLLFRFTGGLISEIHEFTDDQYIVDDLFAPPPIPPGGRRNGWRFGRGRH